MVPVVLSFSLHAGLFAALEHRARDLSRRMLDPHSPPMAGDTFDLDPASYLAPAPEDDSADLTHQQTPEPTSTPTATATPNPSRAALRAALALSHVAAASSANAAPAAAPPPLFGATGVRYATDLATTFTRAFPQAASSDEIWSSAPFGGAGHADVTLVLDNEGHIASTEVGGAPSPSLRKSIEHTLVLLAPRAFTARGAVTRLSIRAHVSRDSVHDGLHGEVFALSAGSFSGEVGTAFFALPATAAGPGRRVDVDVRIVP